MTRVFAALIIFTSLVFAYANCNPIQVAPAGQPSESDDNTPPPDDEISRRPGKDLNFGGGVFPEVYYWNRDLYAVWQSNKVLTLRNLDTGEERILPFSDGLAFPRMGVAGGHLYVAYRDQDQIVLINVATGAQENLGLGFGNDPVAVGHGWFAWQDPNERKVKRRLLTGGPIETLQDSRPTGLSRILPDGSVVWVDTDRFAVAGYTRPCYAGDLTVVEGVETGLVVFRTGYADRVFYDGATSFTPRCAQMGNRHALATWGSGNAGVRIMEYLE